MQSNLSLSVKKTRVNNAAAAGTTTINTAILDMQGFDSVVWDVLFGTLTASQVTSVKVQAGNDSGLSDAVDLAGAASSALADADSNKVLTVEVSRVIGYRYVRLVILRGTANAAVDGVLATQYSDRKQPTSNDATTVKETTLAIQPLPSDSAHTVTTTTYSGSTTRIVSTARTSS